MNFKVELPKIYDEKFNIIDFGAIPGGFDSNTKAIQNAIDEASINGGTVVIPKGIWLTGSIDIKSKVNLHLESGAFLNFSKNLEEFPIIESDYEGQKRLRAKSPIMIKNAIDVAITGCGVIDGAGDLWRPVKEMKLTKKEWANLLKKSEYVIDGKEGGIWFPTKTAYEGALKGESYDIETAKLYYDFYRPVLVNIIECDRVLIDGVTIQNSGAWNIHPIYTNNFTLKNAFIKNSYYAQNGDGLDLESCTNCEIAFTKFDVGDDGICVKSGKDSIARQIKRPTKNVYIHDCIVYHAHGGFVVGSEMSRGIENVIVDNCVFNGTDIGIRFKSALGRGGVVKDIKISNIHMKDIKEEAIIFTMGYTLFSMDMKVEGPKNDAAKEDIPYFKDITISNTTCTDSKCALKILGLDDETITNITLNNVKIRGNKGLDLKNVTNLVFNNVTIIDNNEEVKYIKEVFNA